MRWPLDVIVTVEAMPGRAPIGCHHQADLLRSPTLSLAAARRVVTEFDGATSRDVRCEGDLLGRVE